MMWRMYRVFIQDGTKVTIWERFGVSEPQAMASAQVAANHEPAFDHPVVVRAELLNCW